MVVNRLYGASHHDLDYELARKSDPLARQVGIEGGPTTNDMICARIQRIGWRCSVASSSAPIAVRLWSRFTSVSRPTRRLLAALEVPGDHELERQHGDCLQRDGKLETGSGRSVRLGPTASATWSSTRLRRALVRLVARVNDNSARIRGEDPRR